MARCYVLTRRLCACCFVKQRVEVHTSWLLAFPPSEACSANERMARISLQVRRTRSLLASLGCMPASLRFYLFFLHPKLIQEADRRSFDAGLRLFYSGRLHAFPFSSSPTGKGPPVTSSRHSSLFKYSSSLSIILLSYCFYHECDRQHFSLIYCRAPFIIIFLLSSLRFLRLALMLGFSAFQSDSALSPSQDCLSSCGCGTLISFVDCCVRGPRRIITSPFSCCVAGGDSCMAGAWGAS
ncbi:hypothetical protein BDY21DRAFT_10147 [Lineolata rhizophorae]|uniref:Transmembrane protein n=1 Tax=Lineolata rhizophorae TaxID=578093 RepID=A0A6A6PE42_9PEZI|nr:hypothetical protein BDY21DRAFT_10147 [Lineolata rhizophorae]